MILQVDNWHLGYAQMLTDCRQGGSVWIFCGADADAMAAARIVSYMLRADSVTYQLRPCWAYSSLEGMLEAAEDCKAILLLNVGASRNLTKLFRPTLLQEDAKVYVMDCRRPVHLANVHAGQNVVVFWDAIQPEDVPSDGDNLSGKDDTSSEEDSDESEDSDSDDEKDDESEGEEEFEDDDLPKRSQHKSASPNDKDQEYDGEGEEDENDHHKSRREEFSSPDAKKRKTDDDGSATTKEPVESPEPDAKTMTPRELYTQRRERLRLYYSGGSFYGSPVAWIAYRIASQVRFGDKGDLLWLACVGLTDAYMHARIDLTGYTALSMELKQSVSRLYPQSSFSKDYVVAEELAGSALAPGQRGTKVSLSETGTILTDQDYRFFLLRHTSLFDSMIHSPYVSTRLQLSTSKGMQQLHELWAKMGFPLDECHQPYAFMKPKFRRQLKEKMTEYAFVRWGVSLPIWCVPIAYALLTSNPHLLFTSGLRLRQA